MHFQAWPGKSITDSPSYRKRCVGDEQLLLRSYSNTPNSPSRSTLSQSLREKSGKEAYHDGVLRQAERCL